MTLKKLFYTTIAIMLISIVFCVIGIYTNSRFYIIGLILSIITLFLAFIGYMKAFKLGIITDSLNNWNSEVEFVIPYYKTYDTFKYKNVKIKVLPYIDKHSCKQCFFINRIMYIVILVTNVDLLLERIIKMYFLNQFHNK